LIKRIVSYYKSSNRLYVLFFLSGILTGLLVYFYTEDNYEQNLFVALANDAKKMTKSDKVDSSLLLNSLHVVNGAIKSRGEFFNNIGGLKAGVIQPLTVDLMTGQGACGSYAVVMARLLGELDIESRIVQMKVGEVYGGHNIVEARYGNSWIVVDPLFDLYFKRRDGALASFKDVQHDWDYYSQQLPEDYDRNYRYEDVRYTNWEKIPIVMPAAKKILDWLIGREKADMISLRVIALRKFRVFFIVTLFFLVMTIGYMINYQVRKSKKSRLLLRTEALPTTEENKVNVIVINPAKDKTPSIGQS
jgi:hypothetical protein